jgi:hypothetical protein
MHRLMVLGEQELLSAVKELIAEPNIVHRESQGLETHCRCVHHGQVVRVGCKSMTVSPEGGLLSPTLSCSIEK